MTPAKAPRTLTWTLPLSWRLTVIRSIMPRIISRARSASGRLGSFRRFSMSAAAARILASMSSSISAGSGAVASSSAAI